MPFFIRKDVLFLPYALCSLRFASLFPGHEQVGQKHSDDRDIGDKHERDKHGDIEGDTPF